MKNRLQCHGYVVHEELFGNRRTLPGLKRLFNAWIWLQRTLEYSRIYEVVGPNCRVAMFSVVDEIEYRR